MDRMRWGDGKRRKGKLLRGMASEMYIAQMESI